MFKQCLSIGSVLSLVAAQLGFITLYQPLFVRAESAMAAPTVMQVVEQSPVPDLSILQKPSQNSCNEVQTNASIVTILQQWCGSIAVVITPTSLPLAVAEFDSSIQVAVAAQQNTTPLFNPENLHMPKAEPVSVTTTSSLSLETVKFRTSTIVSRVGYAVPEQLSFGSPETVTILRC